MLEADLQQEFVRLENAVWIYRFFHTVSFVPAACFSGSDLYLKLPARPLCRPEGLLSCSDSRQLLLFKLPYEKGDWSCNRIKGSAQI